VAANAPQLGDTGTFRVPVRAFGRHPGRGTGHTLQRFHRGHERHARDHRDPPRPSGDRSREEGLPDLRGRKGTAHHRVHTCHPGASPGTGRSGRFAEVDRTCYRQQDPSPRGAALRRQRRFPSHSGPSGPSSGGMGRGPCHGRYPLGRGRRGDPGTPDPPLHGGPGQGAGCHRLRHLHRLGQGPPADGPRARLGPHPIRAHEPPG